MTNEELKMCARCQIRWERDKAMEQLEEHHIPFMCIAEDVVQVVRCKDCKWQCTVHDDDDNSNYYMCGVHAQPTDPNAFCSCGERKEE